LGSSDYRVKFAAALAGRYVLYKLKRRLEEV